MAIEVCWHDDGKHIFLWRFIGDWTIDEFSQANKQYRTMLPDTPTHLIIDIWDSKKLPVDVVSLVFIIKAIAAGMQKEQGRIVLVGEGRMLRIALETVQRFYKQAENSFLMADSIEKAATLLS